MRTGISSALALLAMMAHPAASWADDLYSKGMTQSLASDRKASLVGDIVTIVILQAAESSTTMENGSRKGSALSGSIKAGSFDESASLSLGGNYTGRAEVRRSERFVTQMTATITAVLANGDLVVEGLQRLEINGEATMVQVRGRIRAGDIDAENRVPSNRIADAQINYNGKGFVSRSAKPGLIHRIFGFLGLM